MILQIGHGFNGSNHFSEFYSNDKWWFFFNRNYSLRIIRTYHRFILISFTFQFIINWNTKKNSLRFISVMINQHLQQFAYLYIGYPQRIDWFIKYHRRFVDRINGREIDILLFRILNSLEVISMLWIFFPHSLHRAREIWSFFLLVVVINKSLLDNHLFINLVDPLFCCIIF